MESLTAKYFVSLQVGDVIEDFLIDTGATDSVLPASRYHIMEEVSSQLTLADGRRISSKGRVKLPLKTLDGTLLSEHDFVIADVKKCYLGTDILEMCEAVIDSGKRVMFTNTGKVIPFSIPESSEYSSYAVLSDIDFIDDVMFLTDDVPKADSKNLSNVDPICGSEDAVKKINDLLDSYENLFSGIGKTDLVELFIPTTDNVPVNLPSYRLPMHLKVKAKKND